MTAIVGTFLMLRVASEVGSISIFALNLVTGLGLLKPEDAIRQLSSVRSPNCAIALKPVNSSIFVST